MGMLSGGTLLSALGTLGGYASAAMPVLRAVNAIRGVADSSGDNGHDALRAQQDLAMKQLRAQQGLGDASAAERDALDRQKISLDSAAADKSRRDALRRAVARQRAAFGAQGLSATDGSGEAVLLGLFDESESERAAREKLDTLRMQALDQENMEHQLINVLQRTQLKEKQNLDRALSGY